MIALNGIQGYRPTPKPSYRPTSYYAQPTYEYRKEVPECAKSTTNTWCVEDSSYPLREIKHALDENYKAVKALYKDVVVNTALSIDQLNDISEETYLCPSTTAYVQPLRAINAEGKWRVIVNHVESYGYKFTQSNRIEECDVKDGSACPLVPDCYDSKYVQKDVFHRFLVYDPYDYTFPFVVEKFKLPSTCACALGTFYL